MLFAISRPDGSGFRIAKEIDPDYFQALEIAVSAGVEIHIWRADISPEEIRLVKPLP
jgi:sugar fermentation stimulation protein A